MNQHEQMTEVHIEWIGDEREIETERPICRYCWHESISGTVIRSDWPCSTVRARQAVALLNSMILSGEDHSEQSRAMVRRAMDDAADQTRALPTGQGEAR